MIELVMKCYQMPPASEPACALLQSQPCPLPRILAVNVDMSLRKLSTELLILSGYEVDAVADGAAAWEALHTDSYDLLITDNNMPNLTGVELLKKLYATRMALPFIMASGTLPEEEFTQHPWLRP